MCLDNWDINDLLNNSWSVDFNDLLNDDILVDNFRDLHNSINNPLHDSWDFNRLFDFSDDWDKLLLDNINILDNFNWNMHNFLDFFNFGNFNDFFDDLFDRDDLWDFYHSVDNLFDNFLDLDDLGHNSEHLQDIIDIDDVHDFGINHTNDSFIDFEHCSGSSLEFF